MESIYIRVDEWCDSLYLFGLRVKTHILVGVLLLARTGPARARTWPGTRRGSRSKHRARRRRSRTGSDATCEAERAEVRGGEAQEPSHPSRASTDSLARARPSPATPRHQQPQPETHSARHTPRSRSHTKRTALGFGMMWYSTPWMVMVSHPWRIQNAHLVANLPPLISLRS